MALLTRAIAALAACLLLVASASAAALEDAVKATYLYKFAPFVSWPQAAFRPEASAFTLCVSGADAVTALLPEAIAGQQVAGRPIVIHRLADAEAPAACQILYVANSAAAAPQLSAARGKPVLTVTSDDLADHGIIRLTVIDHHVRFDVDEKLANDSGLSISSKLLSLAHAVTPAPGEILMAGAPSTGGFRATSWTAIVGAVILLLVGAFTVFYEEHLYQTERMSQTREQAEILAASVTAALSFNDPRAAQEYVEPMQVNPQIEAVGVYAPGGTLLAGFSRKGVPALPEKLTVAALQGAGGGRSVVVPVVQQGVQLGRVYVRASPEAAANRFSRYGVLALLAVMAVLVIAGLGGAQLRLQRQAQRLAHANAALQSEMAERAKAEEALRQSQKMEAIGQLSGGIAHDFNNLLMIINGNLRLLQRKLAVPDTDRHIAAAAEGVTRAAALTQRILSFSRKQSLTPAPVDLNGLIANMDGLLNSTLRENIEIVTDLRATRAVVLDRNQMENVLLNLAVNARDAMPDGGTFTLRTEDAREDECESAGGLPLGHCVKLTIRDTGTGMSAEVCAKALDPFFTTKPVGQGTGLGLSTTYGFITQSGGRMAIASAPGEGATITILLPAAAAGATGNVRQGVEA